MPSSWVRSGSAVMGRHYIRKAVRTEEIAVPDGIDLSRVDGAIERCFQAAGLHVALKGTVKAHQGSVHWHLRRGEERGTLEVTLWPARRRLWLSVHANRGGEWVEAALRDLADALPSALLA